MVYRLEALDEHELGEGEIAEGDRTLLEETFGYVAVDDAVDEFGDAFLGVLGERTRRCLHAVGNHKNGLLACERVRSGVLELRDVDVDVGMLVLVLDVEILRHAASVVGEDEVAYERRKIGFLCHAHAFGDVAHHDACALDVRHVVVRIDTCLILGEEDGVFHLSDVVIECAGTHEQRVGAYLVGYLGCEISDGDRVLERAGSHLREVAEQSAIGIRQLEERNARHESEHLLDDIHERIAEQQEDAVDNEVIVHIGVDEREVVALHHLHGYVDEGAGECDEERRAEHLGAACEFAQRVDGYESGYELYDDELVLVAHGGGADEHHRDVADERRARVHEDAHEHRRHSQRQYVDAEEVVAHHERHEHREKRDERVEHGDGARFGEVVVSEESEVDGEERDEERHEHYLSDEHHRHFALRGAASFHLALEGVEHAVGIFVDDVAAVYHLLSAHHHSACGRYRREEVVALGLGAALVVYEVRLNIVVEVAALQ